MSDPVVTIRGSGITANVSAASIKVDAGAAVPQTSIQPLFVSANGTYTPDEGKAFGQVIVKVTGPFLELPQSATTPTADDVLSKGVSLGTGNTHIYLSNDKDVYYFRVSNNLVFASRESDAEVFSLYGNGTLRTTSLGFDSTTELYYAEIWNTSPSADIYNCSSVSDGLSRLEMFI